MQAAHDHEPNDLEIRVARADDASELSRLGQLDVGTQYGLRLAALARSPEYGEVLVAEADGALVAALDLPHDRLVADPFRPARAARELLQIRSQQLRQLERQHSGSRRRSMPGFAAGAG